jgi:hypothetical protein
MDMDWGLVVKLALPAKVTRRANKVIGIYDRSHHDQLHSYPLRFDMAVSILNFTCNQMFPFDGHRLATSPQQTIKLQLNLTLTSIN